jgi:hypothetical protein
VIPVDTNDLAQQAVTVLVRLASNDLRGPARQAGDALYAIVASALRRSRRANCLAEFHEDPQSGHVALLAALTAETTRDRVLRTAVSRQVYAVHNARTCVEDPVGRLAG